MNVQIETVLISALVSSLLTFFLSGLQFRSQKWWELKIAAYQKVFEALHYSKKFLDYNYEAELLRKESSDTKNEYEEALRKKASEAGEEIAKAADISAFLLSEGSSKRLEQYRKESKKASEQDSWFGYLDHDLFATNSCLKDLMILAKKDLNRDSFSWAKKAFAAVRVIKKKT